MKHKKPLLLATSAVVAIATTVGVISAATPNPPVPPEKTASVNTTESTPTVTETAPVQDTPTTPTESIQTTQATPIVSQADQNKVRLQQATTDASNVIIQAIGVTPDNADAFRATQWACVDKSVNNNHGYENYDILLTDSNFVILQPKQNDDGTITYQFFDNQTTCRIMQIVH